MRFDFFHRKALVAGLLAGVACSCTVFAHQAQGQGGVGGRRGTLTLRERLEQTVPDAIPGEVVVRLAPGLDPTALERSFGIRLKERLRFAPNTFLYSGVTGDLNAAAAQIQASPGVLLATRNDTFRPTALPPPPPTNDPLRGVQRALRVLGADNLWGLTVGERFVNGPRRNALVAVLDTAFELDHADLNEVFSPASFDFALDAPYDDAAAAGALALDNHGQLMAGCVAVANNNAEGIAGIPWEGVQILACRIGDINVGDPADPADDRVVLTTGNIVDALYYCIQQNADVISMSFGGLRLNGLVQQAIQDCHQAGVVLCASAGNFRGLFGFSPGISFPARFDEVIAVGGVGPFAEQAFYSDEGAQLELMSPGGNDPTDSEPLNQICSTAGSTEISRFSGRIANFPAGYDFAQGTSQACSYVGGVIGTLITQGIVDETLPPAEQVERVRQILRRTARNPFGRRTDQYGFGLIDPGAALREYTHHADILSPEANEVTPSFGEPIQIRVVRPQLNRIPSLPGDPNPLAFNNPRPLGGYGKTSFALGPADFQVLHNGNDRAAQTRILDAASGLIEFEPLSATRHGIGNNTIDAIVNSPTDPAANRRIVGPPVFGPDGRLLFGGQPYTFRVIPRVEAPGLKMISVPFELQPGADDINFVYGGNLVRLARFLPAQSRYAIFDAAGSPQEPEAGLAAAGSGVARPPVGVGYWARVTAETQTQILGRSDRAAFYRVPLRTGFNMVGCPYNFRVPFQLCNVQFGKELLSVTDAVNRNLIRNVIWRFEDGRYTFKILPQGEFVPFESHWIRAFRDIDLIIPRANTVVIAGSRAAASASSAEPAGWRSTVQVSTRGELAGEVGLGQAVGAHDGAGPEDVENPPAAPGKVDIRIHNSRWGRQSGRYARDVRNIRTREQEWTLEVETFRPATEVKLSWTGLPTGVIGSVTDVGSGRVVPLVVGRDLRVALKSPGVRRFVVRTRTGS